MKTEDFFYMKNEKTFRFKKNKKFLSLFYVIFFNLLSGRQNKRNNITI